MTVAGQPLGDGSISEEKLQALLAIGGELDDLDFKEYLDLSQKKDKVELVKDFAAMQSIPTGGYLVVGADDHGVVSDRLGVLNAADFDAANLHRIAAPYLPTVRVRAGTHDVGGVTVAVIFVGPPDPPGVAILVKDGQYADGARSKQVFAPGDVFVRRGTQSVRWSPGDLPTVLARWEEHIREDERRRATAYTGQVLQGERARAIAHGPLGSFTWRLAGEEFEAALLEALRAADSIALRRLVLTFGTDATALARSGERPELDLVLDRLLAALAVTLTYSEREWFDQLLGVLVELYRSAIDEFGNALPAAAVTSQELMWRVAVGVEALGGLAVRMRAWWAVRRLAMPDEALQAQIREPSWIRHAVTAAAWAHLLQIAPAEDGGNARPIGGPTVSMARQLVERIPALRPDTQVSPFELNTSPEPNDTVLDSLIQFDVLWCVIAVAHSGSEHHQYPSFASFYSHRAEPAFRLLINDRDARDAVLAEDAGDPHRLWSALKGVVNTAWHVSASEGRPPWHAESDDLVRYLASEPKPDPNA